MVGTKSLNDEHDCNVISMNSLNTHDANDLQIHKLGDAMFDEDDMFSPPSFGENIYYDESMPPIYDDYIDESGFGRVSTLGSNDPTILEDVESYYDNYVSGFGEVMTLFSDKSTILEEVSIECDNKVAIYDDYGDDIYVIENNESMKLLIMILIFNPMIVTLLSLLPLLFMRINLLMWRVIKFLCLCIMKRMLYVIVILLNFFMMLPKIIMREELMLVGIAIISSFLSMC